MKLRNIALAIPFFVLPSAFASAQVELPPEFEDPVENWVVEREKNESPFHRQRLLDTYAEDIEAGRIYAVVSHLIAQFDAVDWGTNEPQQQKILRQLNRFLAALALALEEPIISGALDTAEEQDALLTALNAQRFGLDSLKSELLIDDTDQDVLGYFAETENELFLYVWTEEGDQVRLVLTIDEVRQWRLLENTLSNLMNEQAALVRAENVGDLRSAVIGWENYLDRGYSQMPWESLVNSWLIEPPELGPPRRQWVFLHPTVGLELSVAPVDETTVKEALHVELFGHIWYRGKELDNFWGISVAASLREDVDPGLGFLVHIRRNWNLGVTWHGVDGDPFLFFSVDLFRFARENAEKYVGKYDEARSKLGLN